MIKPLNDIQLALIGSIPVYILYFLYSYLCKKKALKEIKNNLAEDEFIIYEAKLIYMLDFLPSIALGGSIGIYILPFFLYKNIKDFDFTNGENLFVIIAIPIIFLGLLFLGGLQTVLTNKQIIVNYPLKNILCSIAKKSVDISYSNINYIEYKKFFNRPATLIFNFKKKQINNRINFLRDLKKIKSIIENQINCEK